MYFSCGRIISKNCLILIGKEDYNRRKFDFGQKQNIRAHSEQQVSAIVRELRNNMAPGDDIMAAELVKDGGRMLWRRSIQSADGETVGGRTSARGVE